MGRIWALFAALCLLTASALAQPGDRFGIDFGARALDEEETELAARMDASKARRRISTPWDAMAVLGRRLDAGVYRNMIDGAWEQVSYNTYKRESGQYGYPGGARYVDPCTIDQMVAWLLSDDMDAGVIMGFPTGGPQASACCIRHHDGRITVFSAPLTVGTGNRRNHSLPTGDYDSFEEYVKAYGSMWKSMRTLYYLPEGIGIRWKDSGACVVSEKKGPVLLWTMEAEENHEYDWLN